MDSAMIGFIAFILVVASILVFVLVLRVKDAKDRERVKELSQLYKNLLDLNKKYKFNKLDETLKFHPELKSKRSLENYDFREHMLDFIEQYETVFVKMLNEAEENDQVYKNYLKEYHKLEKYTSFEEFEKFGKIRVSYKKFQKVEHELYDELKLEMPVTSISAYCHATYTSPSGRNHYWRDMTYTHNQLKAFLRSITERRETRIREQEEKEERARKKREKEQKLRQLDKLEKQLKAKEEELTNKEKEFLEATKDQMYSADDRRNSIEQVEDEAEELTISQKMKILKDKFENGEITYEEYKAQRKDLM